MKNLHMRLVIMVVRIGQLLQSKVRLIVQSERGDVPGWVLITVMTAGLVVGLWSIAGPQLKSVLNNALHSVTAP